MGYQPYSKEEYIQNELKKLNTNKPKNMREIKEDFSGNEIIILLSLIGTVLYAMSYWTVNIIIKYSYIKF